MKGGQSDIRGKSDMRGQLDMSKFVFDHGPNGGRAVRQC